MNEQIEKNELSLWLSTYGLLTAEQMLESYGIKLDHDDLKRAINNPDCFYHKILLVPFKNIFNGIIFQQVHDYQVYIQKVFIDYYLSGETSKENESPGASTREDLEAEHNRLIEMNNLFHQEEADQAALFSESQNYLSEHLKVWFKALLLILTEAKNNLAANGIEVSDQLLLSCFNLLIICEKNGTLGNEDWQLMEQRFGQKIPDTLRAEFLKVIGSIDASYASLREGLELFIDRGKAIGINVRRFRSDFYDLILRVNELIRLLPEYTFDQVQDEKNRSSLYFDTRIGEST